MRISAFTVIGGKTVNYPQAKDLWACHKKAIKVHGNKYDYSKVEYKNNKTKNK